MTLSDWPDMVSKWQTELVADDVGGSSPFWSVALLGRWSRFV